MSRPARPDEEPKFGQVWTFGHGGRPLMAVAKDREKWLFVRLAPADPGIDPTVRMFWAEERQPFPDWVLVDE